MLASTADLSPEQFRDLAIRECRKLLARLPDSSRGSRGIPGKDAELPQERSRRERSGASTAEPLPVVPRSETSVDAESEPASGPPKHTMETPTIEPTSGGKGPPPTAPVQETQAPPSSGSGGWTYLVVGLASGFAIAAVGAWLFLRVFRGHRPMAVK